MELSLLFLCSLSCNRTYTRCPSYSFNFGWICEELTPQLRKELDFNNEGRNAEAAASHLKSTGLDCVIPHVLWDFTNDRVLTMDFEEGFRATDVDRIDQAGICR